jgi:hypothetical protein
MIILLAFLLYKCFYEDLNPCQEPERQEPMKQAQTGCLAGHPERRAYQLAFLEIGTIDLEKNS